MNPDPLALQKINSFTVMNGKKIGAGQRTTIAANLVMIGFSRFDVNEIFPMTPWSRSMFSKPNAFSLNFTTTSELGARLHEFMWDSDFVKKIGEANRLEFGEDIQAYMVLSSHSLEPRLAEFSFLKLFLQAILKEKPRISKSFISASHIFLEENGQVEEIGLKEILTDYPDLAKNCMKV